MKKFTLIALALWQISLAHAQWSLTGNSGTNPSTNFLGTTDNNALMFRVNNTFSGTINYSYYNTALGYNALQGITSEYYNTAVGAQALFSAGTSSGYNSAFGVNALYNNSSGQQNAAFGMYSLRSNYTGSELTGLGMYADVMYDGYTNSTAVGYEAVVAASSVVRVGNSSVTSIGGYVGWSNISDGRYKKNVNANVLGLSFINELKPVTYNLDVTGIENHLHPGNAQTKTQAQQTMDQAAIKEKEQYTYSGFIAQDVEAAAKKAGYNFSGVDAPKNSNDLYSLRYSDFVVPLVKAVQELSSQNSNLQSQVDSLQSQINSIQQQLASMKSSAFTSISGSSSYLLQNAPNPFNSSTLINYYIPSTHSSAQMQITNSGGQVVKSVVLSSTGYGQVTINAGELAAGNYFYSLYIDGQLAGTKQMVLIK